MYEPLRITLELSFVNEDEDEVVCVLFIEHEDGVEAIRTTAKDHYGAVENAMHEIFDGCDLGDLFWPLQNEGE